MTQQASFARPGSRRRRMVAACLTLNPHIERDGTHRDRFDALQDGRLLVVSRQPLLDGARALLELGHDPEALLTARHDGRDYDAFKPRPIGELAGWTIEESDKRGLRLRTWRPYGDIGSPAADTGSGGIQAA